MLSIEPSLKAYLSYPPSTPRFLIRPGPLARSPVRSPAAVAALLRAYVQHRSDIRGVDPCSLARSSPLLRAPSPTSTPG